MPVATQQGTVQTSDASKRLADILKEPDLGPAPELEVYGKPYKDLRHSQKAEVNKYREYNDALAAQNKRKKNGDIRELTADEQIEAGRANVDIRFEEFDDGYFDDLRQSARDFYEPGFDDNYEEARRATRYGLARSGNLRSSSGAEALGDLARDRSLGLSTIERQANSIEQSQRAQLESQRQNLYLQVDAATNPFEASQQLVDQSSYLNNTPEFSELGNLFQGALDHASIYQKATNNGNSGFGAISNPFSTTNKSSSYSERY